MRLVRRRTREHATNVSPAQNSFPMLITALPAICYRTGGPSDLPLAVMVQFDTYAGPTFHDGTMPIVPLRRNWLDGGVACSRLQLPLKLAWAVTIHKAQGLTLCTVPIAPLTRPMSTQRLDDSITRAPWARCTTA